MPARKVGILDWTIALQIFRSRMIWNFKEPIGGNCNSWLNVLAKFLWFREAGPAVSLISVRFNVSARCNKRAKKLVRAFFCVTRKFQSFQLQTLWNYAGTKRRTVFKFEIGWSRKWKFTLDPRGALLHRVGNFLVALHLQIAKENFVLNVCLRIHGWVDTALE